MLTDDLLQTDYLSNKVIIDMINVDSTDPLIGEAFADQVCVTFCFSNWFSLSILVLMSF